MSKVSVDIQVTKTVRLDSIIRDLELHGGMDSVYMGKYDNRGYRDYEEKARGSEKIAHIKLVRDQTKCNLKAGKEMVEAIYEFRIATSVSDRIEKYDRMIALFNDLPSQVR